MKKGTKVILGVIIGVLVLYSAFMTFGVYVMSQEYNKFSAGNHVAAKATENKEDYYQMKAFAYSMASAIESGRYDEEQVDELYKMRVEQRDYDEALFRECVEIILETE